MTITTSFQPQKDGRTAVMVLRGGGDDSKNNLESSKMMNVHPVDHDIVLDENATTGYEKRKKKKKYSKAQKHKKKRRKDNHTKHASFMSSSWPSSLSSSSLMPLEEKNDDGDDGKSQRLIKGENCSEDSISTSISNVTNDQGQDQCMMKSSTTTVRHDKLQNAKHPTTSMSSLRSKRDKHPRVGKQGECLRRIKREWKDAVKLGIAYDWKTKETVTSKGRSPSGMMDDCTASTSTNSNSTFFQYNYVRMGPFGKNLLRWHFSVLGPSNSPYSEGIYHGRILLPKNYPMSPPRVQMLTPSGRFVPGEDICLSASNYHPETWTPRWTILSLIDALRLHMLTTPNEIGGIDSTREKRMDLAVQSRRWKSGPIVHGQMVQNGIFCEKIMLKHHQQQQEEDDDDEEVLLREKNQSPSSPFDYCNALELERTLESSHGNKQAFYTHHGKHIKRRKRTIVQQIILCSINIFVEVCKNPYFQLLIVFLALSQYLLHHGYS